MKSSSKYAPSRDRYRLYRAALTVLLAISMTFSAGCDLFRTDDPPPEDPPTGWGSSNTNPKPPVTSNDPNADKDVTWAIYWFICGSDLEERKDIRYTPSGKIMDLMTVTLPDNVTVVIQTGGAKSWHLERVDPTVTNRFVYRGNTLTVLDSLPLQNTGAPETLSDFLAFCNQEYSAEKQVVIIQDHGGGSLHGVNYDVLFNNDMLSLPELSQAMKASPAASGAYELIAFSACLMSTIDCIAVFNGHARYFLASEELQLGIGWKIPSLAMAPGLNSNITGGDLGKIIADGYHSRCQMVEFMKYTTVSVVDLSKTDTLLAAYNDVGIELLQGAAERGSAFFAELGRAAYASENYGSKDFSTSTYDMVDIGDLVVNARALLPKSSGPMLRAINDAMYYHITNPMRANGKGISCFYPYTARSWNYQLFNTLDTSPAWEYLFDYLNKGVLSTEGLAYLESHGAAPASKPETLPASSALGLDGIEIKYIDDGTYELNLGDKADNVLAVHMMFGFFDESDEYFEVYGFRDRINCDWGQGRFSETFNQTWGSIDGTVCHMRVVSQGEGSTIYCVPVFHNGVFKNLIVEYSFTPSQASEGSYEILGLVSGSPGYPNLAEAIFEKLEVGDELDLLNQRFAKEFMVTSNYGGTGMLYPGRTITVTKDTSFYEIDLADGIYMACFFIIDYSGGLHYSKNGFFKVDDGKIEYTEMQ